MRWKVLPATVVLRAVPMILIALTRPPVAPSRLVICSCFTVPTEGHARLMLLFAKDQEATLYKALGLVKLSLEICLIALLIQRFGLAA